MWSTIYIVAGTIVCGCLNSLLTKYQDNQCVRNCSNPDVSTHKMFEQPAIQTLQMFIGELAIYLVYYLLYVSSFSKRSQYTSVGEQPKITTRQSLLLAIPSVCDMLATTLMNIGLVYTPVSIYQMTRGAVVLFVAVMSVLFLKRRIRKLEWIALIIVTLGIAIVGYSGSNAPMQAEDAVLVAIGIGLIIIAVSFQAVQFVVEERIMSRFHFEPMRLVYTEGFFGVVILVAALVILNFVIGLVQSPEKFVDSPFNLRESFGQTLGLKQVLLSSLLIMVCISAFNFCGITLTHQLSATARSTIDSCRTLLVWLVAMVLGWESFSFLQAVGFVVLVFGTLCFNGVLKPEEWKWIPTCLKDNVHKDERLIDVVDEPIDRM